MKNSLLNGLSHIFVIFVIYMILVGHWVSSEIIIGAILSIALGIYFSRLVNIELIINPLNWVKLFFYTILFIIEMIKANIHIALVVLNPSLPIKPSIVKAKIDLKSNVSKLILSSSITLTPGTLTIDIYDDNIFIHCVDEINTDEKSVKTNILNKFEKHLRTL